MVLSSASPLVRSTMSLGELAKAHAFEKGFSSFGHSSFNLENGDKRRELMNEIESTFDRTVLNFSSDDIEQGIVIYESKDGESLLYMEVDNHPELTIYTKGDPQVAFDYLKDLRDRYHYTYEPDEESTIFPITIWNMGPMGPNATRRWVDEAEWSEIRQNYSQEVTLAVDELVKSRPRQSSGLILWEGPPGTGKTTAIRSLMREWNKFASIHIIADPEELLKNTQYLYQVAFSGGSGPSLIILEDSGELITKEARNASGQAVSRLLNFTDGIIGQGLNLYFMITTNEKVEQLHEAVTRPGRSVPNGNTRFGNLSAAEANEWLANAGLPATATAPTSLATLYSTLNDVEEALTKEAAKSSKKTTKTAKTEVPAEGKTGGISSEEAMARLIGDK